MPDDALLVLHRTNHHLRLALDRFRPEQTRSTEMTADLFSSLLAELVEAGEVLKSFDNKRPPAGPDAAALEQETREYRENLEKLSRVLPGVHARLLAEHEHLQNAQRHLAGVALWARASGKAL